MRVIQLAKSLGITPDTVRFYSRIGVLNPQKNPNNGYREYSDKDISRMKFILCARQLDFSVDDIKQILAEADNQRSPCTTVRRLIEQRLQETEQQFEETIKLRDRMREAVKEWSLLPDRVPKGHMICHLIENFAANSEMES